MAVIDWANPQTEDPENVADAQSVSLFKEGIHCALSGARSTKAT